MKLKMKWWVFNKKAFRRNLITSGKIISLTLFAVIPALLVFTYLDVQKEREKAFLLEEIGHLKEKTSKLESEITNSTQSAVSNESTQSSTYNPFSSLISKLLKEKACYQTALANIKMKDIDRLNQIDSDIKACGSNGACKLKFVQEKFLLQQKTNRKGFEDKISSISEMLNSLYKGQYPSKGDPSNINFCDSSIYKSITSQ